MLSMTEAEDAIVRRFNNAKRKLDIIAGICFLISLIICPTLYFVFGNLVFILFLPVFLLVIIELLATCGLLYLKKRAIRRLENEQIAQDFAGDSAGQTEVKMKPKKISGIVTIPQHEFVLQQQLAQFHNANYAPPPRYETFQPPPYRVVIVNNAAPGVHQQDTLRY